MKTLIPHFSTQTNAERTSCFSVIAVWLKAVNRIDFVWVDLVLLWCLRVFSLQRAFNDPESSVGMMEILLMDWGLGTVFWRSNPQTTDRKTSDDGFRIISMRRFDWVDCRFFILSVIYYCQISSSVLSVFFAQYESNLYKIILLYVTTLREIKANVIKLFWRKWLSESLSP